MRTIPTSPRIELLKGTNPLNPLGAYIEEILAVEDLSIDDRRPGPSSTDDLAVDCNVVPTKPHYGWFNRT